MVGLVLEGGGMRAGFVAGAMMALMDKGISGFNRAVAVSASVPTLAYFLTGQRREIEMVWRDELSTPALVHYKNIPATSLAPSRKRPVLDIEYLVYEVFKKKFPLDQEALKTSNTLCQFAVTKVPDGSLVFLKPGQSDIYNIFNAALAVPGAYCAAVGVGGEEFVDGGTVNPLPAKKIIAEGVTRILAILSKPLDCETEPPNFLERTLLWRYFQKHEWMIEKLWESAQNYNEEVSFLEELAAEPPQPRAFIICPDNVPPAKFVTRDKNKINRTIDQGYQKAEELSEEIKRFMRG